MKLHIVSICSLLFVFSAANPLIAETADLDQLECDTPVCEKVADEAEYSDAGLEKSVSLRIDHYSLSIPDKPIKRIVSSEDDVILYYKDDQTLIVSEKKGPDIKNINQDIAYRFPEIVFTKTSKDLVTKDVPEATFWKVALLQKNFYFEKADKVFYSRNGDTMYFISNSSGMGFSGSAMVSTPKTKDVFLKLAAEKMDFETFKRVVFSVKSNL